MLKKAIDKVFNPGYNTHTGLEVSNRDEYTFDKAITDRVFDNINTLDLALREVTANTDVDYLIAGGAVRDGLLGLEPKDYDIFLDLSKTAEMEDEERDDLIALLNYNFHQKVRPLNALLRGDFEIPWQVHDEAYKTLPNCFLVYEHVFEEDNNYQLIYRKNNPDIASDPLGFVVNSFDWSLTKAYCKDGKVFVGQQFVDTMKTKHIESDDYETSRRIRSWFNRNMGVLGTTFKVTLNEVVPSEPKDIYRGIYEEKFHVHPNLAQQIDWPQAGRIEIVNNPIAPAGQRIDAIIRQNPEWRQRRDGVWEQVNNENQAEVAPAVPEV